MQSIPNDSLLKWPPNALDDIRKLHNLDDTDRIKEAVTILENWIQKQDHFVKKDFSKEYLERWLISCKGSVEKTKKQIDRLSTLKTLLPHFFTARNVQTDLKYAMDMVDLYPLPNVTKDFYRIFMNTFHCDTLTDRSILEFFQYNICLCEYLKAHDYVNGYIIVMDLQHFNFVDLLSKLNPIMLQQYTAILTEGFGARLKSIHLMTQSKGVDLVVKMAKQFLSQKISDRIHVHKTLEELHTVVPKDLLPKDYEGKEKPVQEINRSWIEKLSSKEHAEYLDMMSKACTDEQLRRADKFNDEYLGVPGAFRNLKVD